MCVRVCVCVDDGRPWDEVLCMKYGVDQDKEEAKYKVAFFDMDAVVAGGDAAAQEALRRVMSDAKLEKMPAWLRFLWTPLFALIRFVKKTSGGGGGSDASSSGSADGGLSSGASDTAFAAFKGMSAREEDTEELARRVYASHLEDAIFAEAKSTMQMLKYDGYKIVIVGESPDFLLKPLGRALGVSRVISNVLEVSDAGASTTTAETISASAAASPAVVFTGRVAVVGDEPRLTAEGKAARVRSFAKEVGVDLKKSIAYGRSGASDVPLMECCGKAYAVSPDEGLRTAAEEKGWQVLGWAEAAAAEAVGAEAVNGPEKKNNNKVNAPKKSVVIKAKTSSPSNNTTPSSPSSASSSSAPEPAFAYAAAISSTPVAAAKPKVKANPWLMRDPDQVDDAENAHRRS